MRKRKQNQRGFTLVEMSIVLVIIGLIVGGVLVGQDLVKAAQIRAVVTQLQQYDAALNTFRGKYDGVPGDTNRASKFLGCTAGLLGSAATSCDGNGDGKIGDLASLTTPTALPAKLDGEVLAFWYHLSLANMVPGQYTLTASAAQPAASATVTDSNVPATKLKKGGVVGFSEGSLGVWLVGTPGAMPGSGNYAFVGNTLTATEAFGIDNKIDDGMVNTGMAYHVTAISTAQFTGINTTAFVSATATSGTPTCWAATPASATTPVDYQLANPNNACTLRIRMQG